MLANVPGGTSFSFKTTCVTRRRPSTSLVNVAWLPLALTKLAPERSNARMMSRLEQLRESRHRQARVPGIARFSLHPCVPQPYPLLPRHLDQGESTRQICGGLRFRALPPTRPRYRAPRTPALCNPISSRAFSWSSIASRILSYASCSVSPQLAMPSFEAVGGELARIRLDHFGQDDRRDFHGFLPPEEATSYERDPGASRHRRVIVRNRFSGLRSRQGQLRAVVGGYPPARAAAQHRRRHRPSATTASASSGWSASSRWSTRATSRPSASPRRSAWPSTDRCASSA